MDAIGKTSYWTRATDEVKAFIEIIAFTVSDKEIITQKKPTKPAEFIFYKM